MPLYDFHCTKCNKDFEELVNVKDYQKKQRCPTCNKLCKKLLGAPNFQVKGFKIKRWVKSDVNRVYQEMIDDSKARLNDTTCPYVNYSTTPEDAIKSGLAKPTKPEELEGKIKNAKIHRQAAKNIINKKKHKQ